MRLSSLSDGMRPTSLDLAERPERGSHLGRERLWLLPGSEVAALVDLVEVDGFWNALSLRPPLVTCTDQRSDLNPARTSMAKSSGCSHAAK
jgi:hypothetical protein